MSSLTAPFHRPTFLRLIVAYTMNSIGTWIGQVAIALLVLRATHSTIAVAAVWTTSYFGPALLSPLITLRLERVGSLMVLPCLFVIEGALFALLALTANHFSLVLALPLVALDGAAGMTARALLKASIVATTSPAGLLREGNTILVGSFTVCSALGPVLGGALTAAASSQAGLWADAVSFALAAVVLTGGKRPPATTVEVDSLLARLRAGVGYVRESVALRRLLATYAAAAMFGAAILPLEVVLVTRILGGSPAAYGAVLALWGLGAVAGGVLVGFVRRAALPVLLGAAFCTIGVSYVGMGIASSVALVGVFSFVGGIGNGVEAFAAMTAIQEHTADAFQARIGAFAEAVTSAALGVGFVFGGVIAAVGTPRAVYVIAGLSTLALAAAPLVRHHATPTTRDPRSTRAQVA